MAQEDQFSSEERCPFLPQMREDVSDRQTTQEEEQHLPRSPGSRDHSILSCGPSVTCRCHAAQLASIRQMSGQVSRGSSGEYQADEQAGVARLLWRVSGR